MFRTIFRFEEVPDGNRLPVGGGRNSQETPPDAEIDYNFANAKTKGPNIHYSFINKGYI